MKVYKKKQLIYAKNARCPCGAFLAHPKGMDPFNGYWDCSAILEGRAAKTVKHTAQLPFIFWEVR
jgi:hypothetical protein